MNKIWVIAARDYKAAVKTKSFIISLLLMPVLMGGSAVVQVVLKKQANTQDKTFVIVDRTAGARFYPLLKKAAETRNKDAIFDPETNKQIKPRFNLEAYALEGDDPEAVDAMRLELSQRARDEQIWGFVEIGPESLGLLTSPPPAKERAFFRYQSNHPTFEEFPSWVQNQLTIALASLTAGQPPEMIEKQMANQRRLVLSREGLSERDPATGQIKDPSVVNQIARFVVPGALVALMFMIIMLSATPSMHGIVEEKMQKIAEVLLGSLPPFHLMMGKLLGLVGVSLTVAGVYLGGAYWAAQRYGFAEFLPVPVLIWYVLFQVLAVFMYGSLFLAIGAASTDIKETQTLVMPVMLLACIPMFILGTAMEDPNHPLVVGISFFPLVTPMLMMARVAIPPGPPVWQNALAMILVVGATVACVYAAGRIFRIGILMQGKGAKLGQLIQWVFRG